MRFYRLWTTAWYEGTPTQPLTWSSTLAPSHAERRVPKALGHNYSKTKSTTVSGAVLWTTAIKLFLKLSHHQEVDPLIIFNLYVQLWILYQHDSKHTPKTGIYLHDLAVHAASQYQIVCLCSVNVESQECLFSQIKQTSLRKTNRKPENVLTTILLSLQAKKKVGVGNAAMKGQESMVAMVAKKVPRHNGTKALLKQAAQLASSPKSLSTI